MLVFSRTLFNASISTQLVSSSGNPAYCGRAGLPKLTAPPPALLSPALGATEVVQAASVEQNP